MMMLVIFIQVMRKLKSINSIRAKRKRYRNKKICKGYVSNGEKGELNMKLELQKIG